MGSYSVNLTKEIIWNQEMFGCITLPQKTKPMNKCNLQK
jgi:hypothetical protein